MLENNKWFYKDLEKLIREIKNKQYIETVKNISIIKASEKILELTAPYEDTNQVLVCNSLKKLNFVIEKNKSNLYYLTTLENMLYVIKDLKAKRNSSFKLLKFSISKFNEQHTKFKKIYYENSKEIDLFFENFVSYCDIDQFCNEQDQDDLDIDEIIEDYELESNKEEIIDSNNFEFINNVDFSSANQSKTLQDNRTLLISQTTNKVFLPYYIADLEEELTFSKSCSSVEELINKRYILPYTLYTNPVSARFNETYKLMRYKECLSVVKSLNKAFKLAFESNLNPAIISACKDLHELDSYLNCMYTNSLDSFKIFDIKFDMKPIKTSHAK